MFWPTGETENKMPYVEKTGTNKIKEQLWQWEGVMHDPNIDGFNGWGCKKKLLEIQFEVEKILNESPTYAGEEEYIKELDKKKVWRALTHG